MFDPFAHYVSYGATDQQTVVELANVIEGLIVPGTVAAFQREGTGGFVLTLSASAEAPEYVIDPRFPLFQQALPFAKASHQALAELMGDPSLVSASDPTPEDFTPERIDTIARSWVTFNRGYSVEGLAKFDKYAERLNESIEPENVRLPLAVLPPYTAALGVDDPWWAVSRQLFEIARSASGDLSAVRVVAAKEAHVLDGMLRDVSNDERLAVWVSGLQELEEEPDTLATYGQALRRARGRGQSTFALYGGFLSVLFSSLGLSGSSHGIGYGEYREWIELPRSGPPPARYYLPALHRYVSQELAYQLWMGNRVLADCPCPECAGNPPIALEYRSLMHHSVYCRADEIDSWVGLGLSEARERLQREFEEFLEGVDAARLPNVIQRQVEHSAVHITRWIRALALLEQSG